MKIISLFLALGLAACAYSATSPGSEEASLKVDTSRTKEGVIGLTLQGGKGSEAQKLYDSLTIKAQEDHAMGGRAGMSKQGKGISCSVENDKFAQDAYTCVLKVSPKGEGLSAVK